MNIIEKYRIDIKKILMSLKDINGNLLYSEKDIKISKGGEQFQLKCPFHKDNSPSMGINKKYNQYNCFVCSNRTGELKYIKSDKSLGKGTFIYQFLVVFFEIYKNKRIEDNELFSICNIPTHLQNNFLKDLKKRKSNKEINNYKKEREDLKNKKIKVSELNKYRSNNFYYFINRINKFNDFKKNDIVELIHLFNLGYDKQTKTLTIPIIQDGYIRGIYGRKTEQSEGKYINLETFDKKSNIYNWDRVDLEKPVILVEGPLNAIKLYGIGFRNVISLFGAVPYDEQLKKLGKIKKIIIWFDNDLAGIEGIKKIKKELKKTTIYVVNSEGKRDVYDYNKQYSINLIKNAKKI